MSTRNYIHGAAELLATMPAAAMPNIIGFGIRNVLCQAAQKVGGRVLVIVPRVFQNPWHAVAERFGYSRIQVLTSSKDPFEPNAALVIVSHEIARRRAVELAAQKFDVICGETLPAKKFSDNPELTKLLSSSKFCWVITDDRSVSVAGLPSIHAQFADTKRLQTMLNSVPALGTPENLSLEM